MKSGFEILFIIPAFILFGAFILLILGYLDGWFGLRKLYRAKADKLERQWLFQWAEFCSPYNVDGLLGRCNGVVVFGFSEGGVHIGFIFPFSFILRPVMVPWNELILTSIEGKGLGFTRLPNLTVLIPDAVYHGIMETGRVLHTDDLALSI